MDLVRVVLSGFLALKRGRGGISFADRNTRDLAGRFEAGNPSRHPMPNIQKLVLVG